MHSYTSEESRKKHLQEEYKRIENDPGYKAFKLCNECLFNQSVDLVLIGQILELARKLKSPVTVSE